MRRQPDILAEIKYFETKDGGRRTPAKTGFRPQVKFEISEKTTSGHQNFVDKEFVFPGETIIAEVIFLSPHFFSGMLEVGMSFNIQETINHIGYGKILKIINEDLRACI